MEGADASQALQARIAELEEKNNTLEEKNNTLEEKNNTLEEKNNTLEEENKTLKEDKTVLEKDNSIATARADFGRCDYSTKSFAEILVLIASCQFPDVPQSVLDNYVQQEGASNTSREYIDSSASHVTAHQQGATTLQISKIRLHMMQNTKSKVTLMELELDETELESLVSNSLFNFDVAAMNNFVTEQSATLQELRKAFYFRFNDSRKFKETSEFQPIFIDFLKPILDCFLTGGESLSAQKHKLVGTLFIGDENNEEAEKEVNGHTDVLVLRRGESAASWTDSDSLKFHAELKSPFGTLYQRNANAAKDQVVIETEIIAKMLAAEDSGRCRRVFGALTDLFAIAIVVREAQGDEECPMPNPPSTYISRRQVGPRPFLLRLLLLFCDLDDDVWSDLLSRSKTIVDTRTDEVDDAEVGDMEEETANPSQDDQHGAADENVPSNGPAGRTRSQTDHSHFRTSKGRDHLQDEEEDEEDEEGGSDACIRKLFQWEASRRGLAYLSASELNARTVHRFQHKDFPLL